MLRIGTNLSRVDEYFAEGLIRGALAEAWRQDAPIWPAQAPQILHLRGSVVMSALSVPAFALFGPTTFAVRLSGIVFHLASLAALMLMAHRLFGRRAAILSGALWVLAPPALAKIAVLSYGDHVEGLVFVFAAVAAWVPWVEARGGRRAQGFLAGLATGLAISWHAQARLAVAVLALCCALLAPRRLLRADAFTGLLPGLLAGLFPLALGDWITAQPGLLVQGSGPVEAIADGLSLQRLDKWLRLWWHDVPRSLQYAWLPAAAILLALAAASALGLCGSTLARIRRGQADARAAALRAAIFVAYPLAFSVVFAASRFTYRPALDNAISVRYVLPIVPFLLLPIAIASARLLDAGRRVAGWLLVAPALALGAWGSLSTWDLDSMLREPARRAADFDVFANEHFAWGTLSAADRTELRRLELSLYGAPDQDARVSAFLRERADAGRYLALVERHDDLPAWTRPQRFNVPLPPARDPTTTTAAAQIVARLREAPPTLRPFVAAMAGEALGKRTPFDAAAGARVAVAAPDAASARELWRGLGRGFGGGGVLKHFDGRELRRRLATLPPAVDRREVAFGLGLRAGALVCAFLSGGDVLVQQSLQYLDPALHESFARGLGAGYRWRFLDPPAADLDSPAIERLLGLLPADLHAAWRAGFGGSPDAH